MPRRPAGSPPSTAPCCRSASPPVRSFCPIPASRAGLPCWPPCWWRSAPAPLLFIDLDDGRHEHAGGTTMLGFVRRAPLCCSPSHLTMFDAVMLAFFPIFGLRSGATSRPRHGRWRWRSPAMPCCNIRLGGSPTAGRARACCGSPRSPPLLAMSLPFVVTTRCLAGGAAARHLGLRRLHHRHDGRGRPLPGNRPGRARPPSVPCGGGRHRWPACCRHRLGPPRPPGIAVTLTAIYVGLIAGLLLARGELVQVTNRRIAK